MTVCVEHAEDNGCLASSGGLSSDSMLIRFGECAWCWSWVDIFISVKDPVGIVGPPTSDAPSQEDQCQSRAPTEVGARFSEFKHTWIRVKWVGVEESAL